MDKEHKPHPENLAAYFRTPWTTTSNKDVGLLYLIDADGCEIAARRISSEAIATFDLIVAAVNEKAERERRV